MLRAARLVFTLVLLGVSGAAADDGAPNRGPNPYLEQGRSLYEEVKYEKCLERLARASEWGGPPGEQVQVHLYAGLCHFNLGNVVEARAHFERAMRVDPSATLPPFTPPKAVSLFEEVRSVAAPVPVPVQPQAAPDAPTRVELLPPEGATGPPAAPSSAEPRRRVIPAILGGAAIAAGAAGSVFAFRAESFERRANVEPFESTAYALGADARSNATAAWIAFGVATSAAAAALIVWLVNPESSPASTDLLLPPGGSAPRHGRASDSPR